MNGDILYVVMPAYNEAENIRDVVFEWYSVLNGKHADSRLVVADSGSTDDTHEILLSLQKSLSKLVVLSDTRKEHGPKVTALYKYAIEHGADYVFQTDSDGQTNSKEFVKFWKYRHAYTAIFGHRANRGDGKARAFVERVVCGLVFVIFGTRVPDANAPFRLFDCSILRKYIVKMPSDYALPNIILTAVYSSQKENITFRKISFQSRRAGKNSINLTKITKIGIKSLRDFVVLRNRFET